MVIAGLLVAISARGDDDSNSPKRTYSLAKDFSPQLEQAEQGWSFRVLKATTAVDEWPSFTTNHRTANDLWGSDFDSPPRMLSDESGYWGIGRNDAGSPLYSSRNDVRWMPGEMLLHPQAGAEPSQGLAICWTSPGHHGIDVRYSFSVVANGTSGVGFRLVRRTGHANVEIVRLHNIGQGIQQQLLQGLVVEAGDVLTFEIDTCGEPAGDIVKADIVIDCRPPPATSSPLVLPKEAAITAGSRYTLFATSEGARSIQWLKDDTEISGANGATFVIDGVTRSDAGEYRAMVDGNQSAASTLRVVAANPLAERFASATPRQVFAESLAEQEAQLATNELMLRFAASRKKLATDRYRPAYHFVSPESQLNDPNGLCFWQGRWHLFYQAYPPDEFPNPEQIPLRRQHWGHAVSDDLVRWRDLPYAIYPGVERMCFSGGTVVEADRVVAFYPGIHAGQMVAVSHDPLLLNWEKLGGQPVHGSPTGDACIWKEGDTYYGLVGADHLVSSRDLLHWTSHGPFLDANPFPMGDALACPGFVPIGNKHLLVSFSHTVGGQYLLGDYDAQQHRFRPYAQGRFNHGLVSPGGVHAPCAAADGKGNVINILNINDGLPSPEWDQILSLPQRLSLGEDAQLRIAPVEAMATLRGEHHRVHETRLPANQELVLQQIQGNTLELDLEIDPRESRWVQLNVLRSPDAEEQTSITFYNFDRKLSVWYHTPGILSLDGSSSSVRSDVWLRPPEKTTLERNGDSLKLRVFIDRSVVEVFANEKRFLAIRVYPDRADSLGVSLRAQGQDAVLKRLDAWQLISIWP